MKYFTFQYKKYGILNTSASKYYCLLWFSLLSFFTSQAQNQFDLRFQLNTVDCAQATACFDVQIRSANGQNWGLAGQNYRIYYDGNLASFQAGSSQLSNQYEAFMLVQNEQGINASTTNSTLSFENNLSFLNYQIDLANPETGGVNLLADGTWLTTSQLCFAVDAAVINDPNTCLEAIWAKEGLTQEYATAFVEIAEWAGFCETVPAIGAAYDNLESGDGDAACFNLSCPIINPPVADNASYDIRLQAGALDCSNNTICYDVQLRNPTNEPFNLAGQNYRLYYDGAIASWQSGISFLDNNYQDFTLIENSQNVNTNTPNSNLNFENNLSFLNYTMDLNEVMNGGTNLPTDGTWFTTSQLCFAIQEAAINDPNTCLEAIWARDGLTQEYATAFVEVAEWIGMMDTEMADGVGYDDLDAADGQGACFDNVCPVDQTPVTYDIRLDAGDLDCATNTICYAVQLRNPTGQVFNLAGQNYRLYYDGAVASWQSGTSSLDDNYQDFTLIENVQNVNTNTLSSNLNFENNLSFLNYTMDLNEVMTGGIELPIDGTWFTTSELCFEITEAAINDPNTCLEAVWARDGLTHEYATSFVEVAQWVAMMDTEMASGVGYDDLNAADGQAACFMDICQIDTLDLALFKDLADPNATSIAIGGDILYKIGVINEGNVTVESVTITDNLPQETILSNTDTNGWTVVDNVATKILEGPLAPGDTLCAYILLTVIDGSPNQIIFNSAQIVQVQQMNVIVFLDIDSTPNEDDEVNEDDEDSAVITIAPSCPTIDLVENFTICEGGSSQLNPVLSTPTAGNFTWSPALELDNPNSQNPIASPTETTIYTVTFSDGNDCEVTATTTINVGNNLAINLTPDSGVCANTPFQLLATGGMTYNWSPATGLNQTNIANPVATITNTTTYTVTVSDGICTSTASVTLTVDNETPVFNTILQDMVIACEDNIPTLPTILATDNLDNAPNVELIENMSAPNVCPVIMSRIWIATDNCGNQNTMIQTITVVDNQIPVFDNIPADLNLTCGEILPTAINPTVTDNCDNQPVIELMETTTGTDCNQQITRTWTATDNCGNIALTTQIISIQDSEAPKLTGIPDDTGVNCNNIPDPATPTVSDDCDTSVDITFAENQNGSGCNFTLIRTWTATDNCGNTVVKTQNIQVQDNSAPVFVSVPADITVSCGNPVPTATNPVVTDNCDTEVLALASETTIPNDCGFVILRTWTATDDCGNSATAEQTVFVSDVGQPIFSGSPADLTISCTESVPVAAILMAENECNNNPITVTFTENTATDDCGLTINRIWSATDDCGNVGTVDQVIMVMDLDAPIFSNVPTNLMVECGAAIPNSITPTAIDACDGDVAIAFAETESGTGCNQQITRTWTATDDCGNLATAIQTISVQDNIAPILTGIPLNQIVNCGAIPDPANPTVSDDCDTSVDITFAENQNGSGCNFTLIRTWTATDNCGNTVVKTQNIQVQDNSAPVFVSVPADITVSCGNPVPTATNPVVTDNCDTEVLALASETTIPNDCGFVILRTWTATDDCGNSATAEQTVFVSDVGQPIFSGSPADLTISCTESVPVAAILMAENECNNNPITVTFTENTATDDCGLTINRIWSATDDCGNVGTVDQVIMVMDLDAPIFSNVPTNLMVECGAAIPNSITPTAIDACDGDVAIAFAETESGTGCNQQITRTWTATDDCGNLATAIQTISVQDNIAPILTGIPLNQIVNCGAIPDPANPIATDNCDTNIAVVFTEEQTGTGCQYTLIRTWTATDNCGNATVETQLIQFEDSIAPMFTSSFPDININCSNGQNSIPTPIATDNCPNGLTIAFEENMLNGNCASGLNKIRTWIATDNCGNTTTATQSITIQDDSLPILGGIPADLSLDCNDIPPPAIPIATDACDTNVEVIFEEIQMGQGCEYSLIRTWTATDDCGNSVMESQTINVNDSTPPVITPTASLLLGVSSGDTLIMQCGATDIFGDNDAIAIDDCDDNPSIELMEGNIIVSTCADDDFLVWMECYWEAIDACGNSSQFLIYIKVVDTMLPQFSTVPTNVTLSCEEAIPTNLTPTVSDNCTSVTNLQVIEQEDIILGNCEGERTIIRTWIAIDQCGNSNTFNQTILIQDNLAPEILGSPADLTIDESVGQTIPFPAIVTAEDNCSQDITVVFNQTETQGDCEQIIIRTWSATDDCGNVTTVSQTITVLEDCEDCVVPVVENISILPTICNQSTGTANIDLVGNESDYTFTWIPDFGMPITAINNARTNLPAGNYLVVINYQGQADCEDKVEFTIEDDCPTPPQLPLLIADFEAIGFKCESTNPIYCLDIPFSEINDFTIKVNGTEFHDFSAGCDFEQTHGYSFSSLGGNGNIGNFVLDSWIVDGQDYNTTFSTTTELVDFMNAEDPEGFWYFNQTTLIVTGEITGKTYGSMNIRHLPTGITSILVLNTNTFATGAQLNIPKDGMHEIVVTRNADQATDTLQLMAVCMTTDTIFSTLELGQTDEMCLSQEELYGELRTVKNLSIESPVMGINLIDDWNACFNCFGKAIGTNETILVICDEYGLCDTTFVITEVRAAEEDLPVTEETDMGAEEIIIYSGFSPNGDGINDHFTIVGLDKQHGYQLSVFNRWGERVFQSQDYQNDWDATHNGANLPDGTYFYVLKIKDGKPHSGYVQIHR